MRYSERASSRERGNVLLLSVVALSILASLSLAHVAVVQKNLASTSFYGRQGDLRRYAESGVSMALHDMRYNFSSQEGKLGSLSWSAEADDIGADGVAATGDVGEGDGIPTVGEPNVYPMSVGPDSLEASLVTHVFDVGGGIWRVVATCSNSTNSATVEKIARSVPVVIPKVGSVLVDPEVSLDLKGNSFSIDGRDYDLDDNLTGNQPLFGIATTIGDPPGVHQLDLLSQIDSKRYDQVLGLGGEPSLGEVSLDGVSPSEIFQGLAGAQTQVLAPGTHSSLSFSPEFDADGNPTSMPVVYVDGDLHLSGNGSAMGVLVVNGSLTVTGQYTFKGLVAVNGDLRLSGGGASIHVLGAALVTETVTAIDYDFTVTGSADIHYSSAMLDMIQNALSTQPSDLEIVFHDES